MEEEFEDDGWMGRHRPGDEEVNAYNQSKFAHQNAGSDTQINYFVFIVNLGGRTRRADGESTRGAQRMPD